MIAALLLHADSLWLFVIGTFGFSAATWGAIALGTGAAGAGLSLAGANAQKKAQTGADNANKYAIEQANKNEWNNYLLQRGLYTGGTAAQGVIPGAQPGSVQNTKLPLWMTLRPSTPNTPGANGGSVVRRKAGR